MSDAIRRWAEMVAGDILTVNDSHGTEGTRAQIMIDEGNGVEKNLGGRCKSSIADVIETEARELFATFKERFTNSNGRNKNMELPKQKRIID